MYSEEQVTNLLEEIADKYWEYIEMTDDPEDFMMRTLAVMILKERERNECYRKLYGSKV